MEPRGVLPSLPTSPSITLDEVEPHVALALRMRPDLNQARLLWQRDDLEIVKTRNGLLPRLDLFVTLGRTGFAESFGNSIDERRMTTTTMRRSDWTSSTRRSIAPPSPATCVPS